MTIFQNIKLKHLGLPVVIGILFIGFVPKFAQAAEYYVDPGQAGGVGDFGSPFSSLQEALDQAKPGDVFHLADGEYFEDIETKTAGTKGSPITITGGSGAVIKGGGASRVVQIKHDYYVLNGFTVDGLRGSSSSKNNYRDILIYVLGQRAYDGVDGFVMKNMTIKNAGGECVRLRYYITNAEISHNIISHCGVYDFVFGAGGKNGEGIYLGTSSNQWSDGKNPTSGPDISTGNHIHHNTIITYGNECVDIKEGATNNLVEYNICGEQKDPESGGFGSRGSGNTFQYNTVTNSLGAGIRIGGWKINGVQYGENNRVIGNTITGNQGGGIKFQVGNQSTVCGNQMSQNTGGDSVGTYGESYQPSQSCDNASIQSGGAEASQEATSSNSTTSSSVVAATEVQLPAGAINLKDATSNSSALSNGYGAARLWDGCYVGSDYSSSACTTGSRDASSFWVELDLGRAYKLTSAWLYGDAEGDWVSREWRLLGKEDLQAAWSELVQTQTALGNRWFSSDFSAQARYVRLEVFGSSQVQAREFALFGKPIETKPFITGSSAASSGGGGGATTLGSAVSSASQTAQNLGNTSSFLTVSPNRLLRIGTRGEDVRLLQKVLLERGFAPGVADGIFGLKTKQAVAAFQRQHSLAVDGVVGGKTIAALNIATSSTASGGADIKGDTTEYAQPVLHAGMSGASVSALQALLSTLGYDIGAIDGQFGPRTKLAVMAFQKSGYLTVDGIVGAKTWNALTNK